MNADDYEGPPGLAADDITRLLQRIGHRDREAVDALLPLVYQQLRDIAGAQMAGEGCRHTLQATALVNEAWIRLMGAGGGSWTDRNHFYRAAASVMRHVLVDHARRRRCGKRGGDNERVPLDPMLVAFEERAHDLVALDEAMRRLEAIAPRQIDIIELRFFAGLTMEQAAEVLGISERTAFTEWRLARGWLLRELDPSAPRGV